MNVKSALGHPFGQRTVPVPTAPKSVLETGLPEPFLIGHLCKTVYRLNLEMPSEMAAELCISVQLVQSLIDICIEDKLMEALGQLGASMTAEMRYGLSLKGREWAREAAAQNDWIGPLPVPLDQFVRQVDKQRVRGERLARGQLEKVFANLTLSADVIDALGPAVNAGSTMLLYGPPGNGKSSIAWAVSEAFKAVIFVPYALEVDNQIITIFDPTVHKRADEGSEQSSGLRRESANLDRRFVPCLRPSVITGGELTIDMLDLGRHGSSGVYEAPPQLKATGGVLVVDDFGRQRESPQALMNRLIVPLENKVDFLSLANGRKFSVPFDALVIFSTNIPPLQLADDAALRRLHHKILIDKPDRDTFIKIFILTAHRYGLDVDEELLAFILFDLYEAEGVEFHAFQPKFLIEQCISISSFEGVHPQLNPEFLRRAWRNLAPPA